MAIDFEALGITKEELQQRVVEACVSRLFDTTGLDEDGDEFLTSTPMQRRLETSIKAVIDTKVADLFAKHVEPLASSFIENLTLQETNRWGEKTGKPVTFIEYLIGRAENYLREEVNYQGKTQSQDSCGWRKSGTRIAYMVHEHLQFSIETAMKQALATANSQIAGGIAEAVKIKLAEVQAMLKVEVKTR